MKCGKCKKEIPDDADFCYHCGYEVIKQDEPQQPKPKPKLPLKAILAGIGLLVLIFVVWRIVR